MKFSEDSPHSWKDVNVTDPRENNDSDPRSRSFTFIEANVFSSCKSFSRENDVIFKMATTNDVNAAIMEPVSLSDGEDQDADLVVAEDDQEINVANNMEISEPDVKDSVVQDENVNSVETNHSIENLSPKIEMLEKERGELTAEVLAKDTLIANFEKECSSLKAEVAQLESSHASAMAEHERKFLQLSEEMSAKVAELKKQYIAANKEKESMVMKYALNEKEIIIQKKHRDEAEKKMKAAIKDKEEAVNKAKNAIADKLKLQQLADSRVSYMAKVHMNHFFSIGIYFSASR